MKQVSLTFLMILFAFAQCKKKKEQSSTSWIVQNVTKTGTFAQKDSILKYTLQQARLQFDPNDTIMALIFHKIAANYKNNEHWEQAIAYCDSALSIREKILPPDHSDIAKSNVVKGSAFVGKNEPLIALVYLQKAFKTLYAKQDTLFLSYIYKDLARCYYESGDFETSLETYKNALNYLKPSENNYHQCFMEMGIVYDFLKQPQQATEHYQKALNWYLAHPDSFYIAACYHNLAMLQRVENPSQALDEFKKALNFQQQQTLSRASTWIEMAKSYVEIRQYEQAKTLANQALQIRNHYHRDRDFLKHYDITESYTVLGDIAAAQNDFPTALNHYEQAINAFDERTFTPVQKIEPLLERQKC